MSGRSGEKVCEQETGDTRQWLPRHRPLLSAAVAFAAGIAAAQFSHAHVTTTLLLGIFCAACLIALRRRLRAGFQFVLVLVLVGAAGAATEAYHLAAASSRAETSLSKLIKNGTALCYLTGTVSGEIVRTQLSPPIETKRSSPRIVTTCRVSARQIESNGRTVPTSGDVRVSVSGEFERLGHGDLVRVFGWITSLDPDMSYNRYSVSRGLVAAMSVAGPSAVIVEKESPGSFFRALYAVKKMFRRQIDGHLGGGASNAAMVLKALLLGDMAQLDRDLQSAFRKSGTIHILVISGLHVSILYGAAIWLCRMLLIQRWRRSLIVLSGVIAFAVMTGFGAAIARATLMIILFELGILLKLSRDPINAVAAAALLILAVAPQYLFEAGFQLTFVAVLGILLLFRDVVCLLRREPDELERLAEPEFRGRFHDAAHKAGRWLIEGIAVSAMATIAVTPLQAYYFGMVTPVSVIATPPLVLLSFVLVPFGLVFMALAPFVPPLAAVIAWGLSITTGAFLSVARIAASVPFGHEFTAPPPAGWVWAFYAALLLVAARKWLRLSGARAATVPVCLLCVYLGWRTIPSPGPEFAATFLNVGHGTCVVITQGRQTVVYDCGSGTPFSTRDVGARQAASHMWKEGIRRIDLLILSHTDVDHVNGVPSLLDRFPVGRVVANKSFEGFGDKRDEVGSDLAAKFHRRGIPFEEAGAGDRITLKDIEIEVLWPPKTEMGWALGAVNDRSLVARVRSGERTLLLTGDIECAGIGGLLATRQNLEAEVLYLPHHGADEPVLAGLVRAVNPKIAVISDEKDWSNMKTNKRARVLKLLRGVYLYTTFECGDIHLKSTPAGWQCEHQ